MKTWGVLWLAISVAGVLGGCSSDKSPKSGEEQADAGAEEPTPDDDEDGDEDEDKDKDGDKGETQSVDKEDKEDKDGKAASSTDDDSKPKKDDDKPDAKPEKSDDQDDKDSDDDKDDDEDDEKAPVVETCEQLTCTAAAVCDDSGETPVCTCPDGYDDVSGDATDCQDIDECQDEGLNHCAAQAECENSAGGYTCTCPAPAYEGDGMTCGCAEGYAADPGTPGRCRAENGNSCSVNADCLSGACEGGTCCAAACDAPGNCQAAEGATCEDGSTCQYLQAAAGTACDDQDACTDDVCDDNGQCVSAPFDANERCIMGSSCQAPSCDSALGCVYTNVAAGTACDDGDPCTTTDTCDALGACLGSGLPAECDDGNECTEDSCVRAADAPMGFNCQQENRDGTCDAPDACAASGVCTDGTCQAQGQTCGAGDPVCLPGPPKECVCAEPEYVLNSESDVCVPNDDDCVSQNPCAAEATCSDPSAEPGDALCTCPEDLVGDGRIDGSGCTPCDGALGTAVNGACVCDLGGTFAMRMVSNIRWEEGTFEEAQNVVTESWSLRTHTYDHSGTLVVTERACGATTPELCVPFFREAMSATIPNSVFDAGRIPGVSFDPVSLVNALPGEPFHTPPVAALVGINLPAAERLTYWPPSWDTSGVNWLDADGDGPLGITTFWRGEGTSETCPRNSDSSRYDYAYVPVPVGLRIYRVQEVYGASRMISSLDGTINDCDTISGAVHGRTPNEPYQMAARALGCKLDNGQDCASVSPELVAFLDSEAEASPQQIDSATFVIKRLPAGMEPTCENVRGMDFTVPDP